MPRQWIVFGEILNVKASVSITSNQKNGYIYMGTGVRRAECPIDRNYQESGGLAGVGSCSGGRLEDLRQVCIVDLINDGN